MAESLVREGVRGDVVATADCELKSLLFVPSLGELQAQGDVGFIPIFALAGVIQRSASSPILIVQQGCNGEENHEAREHRDSRVVGEGDDCSCRYLGQHIAKESIVH